LFWVLYNFLHWHFMSFILILCVIGFVAYRNIRTKIHNKFDSKKILYSISIGQLTAIGLSILFICHSLDWHLRPHAVEVIRFIGDHSNQAILIALMYVGMFLALPLSQFSCSISPKELGLQKPRLSIFQTFKFFSYGCIVVISIRLFFYFIFPESINNQVPVNFIETNSPYISILLFAGIAPFIEELFYRGLIFNTLKENIKLEYSLILQAFLFAISHGAFDDFAIHFINGLIYGYLYFKTRSLLPSIILHLLIDILFVGIVF